MLCRSRRGHRRLESSTFAESSQMGGENGPEAVQTSQLPGCSGAMARRASNRQDLQILPSARVLEKKANSGAIEL